MKISWTFLPDRCEKVKGVFTELKNKTNQEQQELVYSKKLIFLHWMDEMMNK